MSGNAAINCLSIPNCKVLKALLSYMMCDYYICRIKPRLTLRITEQARFISNIIDILLSLDHFQENGRPLGSKINKGRDSEIK